MTDLATLRALLRDALADSDEAPLSVRKAMLVVMLTDALVDQLAHAPVGDPLLARADHASKSPELAVVLELAGHHENGPRLVVESVEVPLADYGSLSTADFMVSLYNQQTVPRLMVSLPDGALTGARAVLHEAVRFAVCDRAASILR